jgi:hypothetical protein
MEDTGSSVWLKLIVTESGTRSTIAPALGEELT